MHFNVEELKGSESKASLAIFGGIRPVACSDQDVFDEG